MRSHRATHTVSLSRPLDSAGPQHVPHRQSRRYVSTRVSHAAVLARPQEAACASQLTARLLHPAAPNARGAPACFYVQAAYRLPSSSNAPHTHATTYVRASLSSPHSSASRPRSLASLDSTVRVCGAHAHGVHVPASQPPASAGLNDAGAALRGSSSTGTRTDQATHMA